MCRPVTSGMVMSKKEIQELYGSSAESSISDNCEGDRVNLNEFARERSGVSFALME